MSDCCPCGSGLNFDACCEPFLMEKAQPKTAAQLMRSRYTAYVFMDEAYLLRSWHSSTRPARLGLQEVEPLKWLGLEVIRTEAGGELDDTGQVEFSARYKPAGAAGRVREVSCFVREQGTWFYLSGVLLGT